MKHILQKHKDSCGPSVIAMVMDIDYDLSLKICGKYSGDIDRNWNDGGIDSIVLEDVLNAFKIKFHALDYNPKLSTIKSDAILIVPSMYRKDCCHVVVFDYRRKQILDPHWPKPIPMNSYKFKNKIYDGYEIER